MKTIEDILDADGHVDLNAFLQLNKKRNRVVLSPSNNIFLKEENNQALTEISHINNIGLSVRIVVFMFISILLAIMIVELTTADKLRYLNLQFKDIHFFQKKMFLLNGQYNLQHMQQSGTPQHEVFTIGSYTRSLK